MVCETCPIRGHYQPVHYSGQRNADVVIMGESPMQRKKGRAEVFEGQAGDILLNTMTSVGIDADYCRFVTATRCALKKKDLGQKKINSVLFSCRPYLVSDLKDTNPKLIVAMGELSIRQLMGKQTGAFNKNIVGNWFYSAEFDCDVLACNHPAALLYNPTLRDQFVSTFSQAARYITNGFSKIESKLTYKEVDSIRPLLDGELPQDSHGKYLTALDTETQGTQWYLEDSVLISYSIAASFTEGWQIYLQEEVPVDEGDYNVTVQRGGTKKDPEYITVGIKKDPLYEQKIEELRELLGRSDIKVYYANMKFEKHRWYNLGITENNNINFDVLLGCHTLDSEQFLNTSLDQVIKRFDPEIAQSHKDMIQDKGDMLGETLRNRDLVSEYAALDAVATLRCGRIIRKELLADKKLANYYARCVHPIETELLFELERNGVYIDVNKLPEVRADIQEQMAKELGLFHKYCPDDVKERHPDTLFRPTRDIIMKEALYNFLNEKTDEYCKYGFGLTPYRFSPKTKLPSVDKESLTYLLKTKLPKKARNLITAYQEWQSLNTIDTRYLKNIEKYVTAESRLHPSYSITFTSSGRTGARNPSIQNFQYGKL